MINVLLLGDRNAFHSDQQKLSNYLAGSGQIHLELTSAPERLGRLEDWQVVVVSGFSPLPDPEQAAALVSFVRRGGGLVLLGDTAETWQGNGLQELAGLRGGYRTPLTELVVRQSPNELFSANRLAPSFSILDSFYLVENWPEDSHPVLTTNWHLVNYPLAFTRQVGQGHLFYTSLGQTPSSLQHPDFQQLIYRGILFAAGRREGPAIGAGMVGYGAIGFEHGEAISRVEGLEFLAVADRNPARLAEATRTFPGLKTYEEMDQIAADPAIKLVFVSTPPNTHAPVALKLLQAVGAK